MNAHIDDQALARVVAGVAEPTEHQALLEHADSCPECAQLLAGVLRAGQAARTVEPDSTLTDADRSGPERLPRPGDVVDQYTIHGIIGRGAMGVVLRAHDRELGRDVALKLLLRAGGPAEVRRLVREAQAMAQLQHPNVVTVYGVGRYRDGVYIAMALIDGVTLGAWLRAERRPWQQTLRTFLQAGEGLVAAHAAGIVHRDFKPANVLVGRDGRALVTDFGLAGVEEGWESGSEVSMELGLHLTRTGAILGTPRYMAPEQLSAEAVDARADQFSFAVSLYAALYGRFPFAGETLAELTTSLTEGDAKPPPRDAAVPAAVWLALRPALQLPPEDRHASVAILLAALHAALESPRVRRRRVTAIVIGIAGLGAGLAVAAGLGEAPCTDLQRQLEDVWDDQRQAAVEARLRTVASPAALEAAERVGPQLNAFAARWTDAAGEVCEATHVVGTQSAALLDVRMDCLQRAKLSMAGVVDVLAARAEAGVVQRAVTAVAGLPRPEACVGAPMPQHVAPVEAPERSARVAHQRALLALGLTEESLDVGRTLVDSLQTDAARGEALVMLARGESSLGNQEPTLRYLYAAGEAFATAQLDFELARTQVEIAAELREQGRPEAARGALDVARLTMVRAGSPAEGRRSLAQVEGNLLGDRHENEASLAAFDAGVAAAEELGGELLLATARRGRGGALIQLGRFDEGLADTRYSLEVRRRLLGPLHPMTRSGIQALAADLVESGRFEEAREMAAEGLAATEAAEGADSPNLAQRLSEAALMDLELGEFEAAAAKATRALAIYERGGQSAKIATANPREALAIAYSYLDRHDDALREMGVAFASKEAAYGTESPQLAVACLALGEVQRAAGQAEAALESFERALALGHNFEALVPYAQTGIGKAMTDLGQEGAVAVLEEAVAGAWPGDPEDFAEARFELARARHAAGDPDAVALAQEAEVALRAPRSHHAHARVVAWLAANAPD